MSRVTLIAEVSTNHGGSLVLAKEFIDRFAEAGADLIKFQLTRVAYLRPTDAQYDWFQQVERPLDWWQEVAAYCPTRGVSFLATVFSAPVVPELRSLSPLVKVGSGEAQDRRLAEAIQAATFERIYVSQGIRPMNHRYQAMGAKTLACVSRYPAPYGLAGLAFTHRPDDGWSDHAIGLNECQVAVQLGATIIEKHVQLRQQARPPQSWEADVAQFNTLREWVDLDPGRFLGRWQHGVSQGAQDATRTA